MKRTRKGARVVVLNGDGRFLLLHFRYDRGPLAGTDYWGLPGGGLENGETPAEAAARELAEETGIRVDDVGPLLAESAYDFRLSSGEEVTQHDYYFLARIDGEAALSGDGRTREETDSLDQTRWWSVEELRDTGERVIPGDMAAIVERISGGAARGKRVSASE